MALNLSINAGILYVQKNVPGFDWDTYTLHLERLLDNKEKIVTIRSCSVKKDSSKVNEVIEDWTNAKKVNLIFVVGDINPHMLRDSYEFSKYAVPENAFHSPLIHQDTPEEKLLNRCYYLIKNKALLLFLRKEYSSYEDFIDEKKSEILAHLQELPFKEGTFCSCSRSRETSYQYFSKSKVEPIKVAERPRNSVYPMISVKDAVECILRESCTLNTEEKSVHDAFSCILAEDLIATEPYPQFPASIKDGYAVLASDTSTVREVIGVVTPGCKLDFNICPGTCVRVSTGSAVPDKADAVIQVEDTTVAEKDSKGNEIKIYILKPAKLHQDIRSVGSDVAYGQVLIPKGSKISSSEIGVMAICGIQKALVFSKPWVALLSTGDEVLEPDSPLLPGCIRDSNKSSLKYILIENRIPVIDAGISRDFADDVKSRLAFAFNSADIVITTGGVSMGEKDILKQVLEVDFGANIHFGRILMKPGKPTTFSTVVYKGKKKLVFSLPGNPVSAYVCFYLFVIPCIKKLMGYKDPGHTTIKVELACDLKLDERPEFARVFLKPTNSGTFLAYSTGYQQSSRLLSMQNADGLLVLPPGTEDISVLKAGTKVDAIPLKTM